MSQEDRQFWEAERQRGLAEAEEAHGSLNGFVPGSPGAHELLDRASIVADLWERLVRTHPACLSDEELHAQAASIAEQLAEFYQLAGSRAAGGANGAATAAPLKSRQ